MNVLNLYRDEYPDVILGLSDHTIGHSTVLGAITLGARVIEKHFTNNKRKKGNDHYHSMDKSDLKTFFKNIKNLKTLLGESTE